MRRIAFGLIFLVALVGSARADECVYLAAGGKVTVYRVDEKSGKLAVLQTLHLPGAGPMTASNDRTRLYVRTSLGRRRPAITTLHVASDGKVKVAHTAKVNLGPGYLCLDRTGRFLAGNHYGPGKVTVWALDDGVYRGETLREIELEKRAHSAVFSPDNRFLLVPATGPNKVFQLRFDAEKKTVTSNDPAFAPGPKGDNDARQPRHLVFHPKLPVVYTSNEREQAGVGMWAWDKERGTLKVVQNVRTTPTGFTTADLHVTPDGKYLYLSNRDSRDRRSRTGKDTIAAFSLDSKTGRMTEVGQYPCEHIPRSMDLHEKGRFLYVAGQMDDRLGVYGIDAASGKLTKVEQYKTPRRPIWVHCMKVGQ